MEITTTTGRRAGPYQLPVGPAERKRSLMRRRSRVPARVAASLLLCSALMGGGASVAAAAQPTSVGATPVPATPVTVAALAAPAQGGGAAGVSNSHDWGPLSSYYKKQKRVEGHGRVYIHNASEVRTEYVLTDPAKDGNTVYARTEYYFWRLCGSGDTAPSWCLSQSRSTKEIRNTTKTFTTAQSLHTQAASVRAVVQVCAQMGWPVPDSCSDEAVITIAY